LILKFDKNSNCL